ncbi:MAG TPA: TetR/AcrR family transcriptional regulator [Trueperaceae bacterium]
MTDESNRRQQIVAAALEEFAAKGFKGATIKSIAKKAQLASPALIYHYFPDKDALFTAVVETQALEAPFMQLIDHADSLIDQPPRLVLMRLGAGLFEFRSRRQKLIRLVAGEVFRHEKLAEMFVKIGPGRVIGFLENYLSRQVELGRLEDHDTRAAARAFVGMLLPQLLGRVFLPSLLEGGPSDEEHLRTSIDTFLQGLERGRKDHR